MNGRWLQSQLVGNRTPWALLERLLVLALSTGLTVRLLVLFPDILARLAPTTFLATGIIGIGVGILLSVHPKDASAFWGTLWHELTHLLFLIASGCRPTHLCAEQGSGKVQYVGPGNWLISLSPYFFPLPTTILMALSLMVIDRFQWIFHGAVAASYAAYLLALASQLRLEQTDIARTGPLFAMIFIAQANLWIGLLVLFCIQGNMTELVQVVIHGNAL